MQVKCSHRLALMCAATCVQQPLFLLLGKGGRDLVLLLEYYFFLCPLSALDTHASMSSSWSLHLKGLFTGTEILQKKKRKKKTPGFNQQVK